MINLLFDTLFYGKPANTPCVQIVNTQSVGYGDLLAQSGRVANALTALGVQPGDRVAAQIDKSVAAIALYLGTVRAGAVYLPLNTAYTAKEIEYFVNDANPALLICQPEAKIALSPVADKNNLQLQTLDSNGTGGSWADLVSNSPIQFTTVERTADDLAAILYTSGTTGRAKGAMISHNNLVSNANTLTAYWGFTDKDVLLHSLPIFHIHGLFVAINVVMTAGASMEFLPRFDTNLILEALPRCSVMMGVPTFYTRLLALEEFKRESAAHMRLFISGSAPMTMETHKNFSDHTGFTILERYGMTETNMNTSNPVDGKRIQGSVGLPLPGIEIRVTDTKAIPVQEVPNGDVGMIEVRGPNVFKGYWEMPDKTAEEFRADGFFITGDLGMIDDMGYVHIVGRDKDLIISGGFNVYPKEVELEIDRMDEVSESAVIGIAHSDFGETVVAVVVLNLNAIIDGRQIIESLQNKVAKFKIPKKVFFIDELPRNAMGKVQKKALRETYERSL